jgi:hypothetical protein
LQPSGCYTVDLGKPQWASHSCVLLLMRSASHARFDVLTPHDESEALLKTPKCIFSPIFVVLLVLFVSMVDDFEIPRLRSRNPAIYVPPLVTAQRCRWIHNITIKSADFYGVLCINQSTLCIYATAAAQFLGSRGDTAMSSHTSDN